MPWRRKKKKNFPKLRFPLTIASILLFITNISSLVEYVIFVKMSELQLNLYQRLLTSRLVRSCLTSSYSGCKHLICINALKKLCNDPKLIHTMIQSKMGQNEDETVSIFEIFRKDNYKHITVSSAVAAQWTGGARPPPPPPTLFHSQKKKSATFFVISTSFKNLWMN